MIDPKPIGERKGRRRLNRIFIVASIDILESGSIKLMNRSLIGW